MISNSHFPRGFKKGTNFKFYQKEELNFFLKNRRKTKLFLCVCFLLTFHSQLPARTIGEMGNKESVEFITTGGSGPGPGTAAGDPTKPVMRTSLSMEPTSGLCCVVLTWQQFNSAGRRCCCCCCGCCNGFSLTPISLPHRYKRRGRSGRGIAPTDAASQYGHVGGPTAQQQFGQQFSHAFGQPPQSGKHLEKTYNSNKSRDNVGGLNFFLIWSSTSHTFPAPLYILICFPFAVSLLIIGFSHFCLSNGSCVVVPFCCCFFFAPDIFLRW